MIAKNCAAALCAAAVVGQAAAGIVHRHPHFHQKKDVFVQTDIVVVTDWVTVVVTDGQEAPTAVPTATVSAEGFSVASAHGDVYKESSVSVAAAPPAVSTTAPAPAPAPTTAAPVVPVPTTLASVVKPADPTTQVAAPVSSYVAQPAPSSSAAPASTGVPSTGVSGTKRGLVYNEASLLSYFGAKCSWAYNWDSTSATIPSGLSYVPMLWGTSDVHTNNWEANANKAIAAGSTHLLSFNEPDNGGQANLSPAAAATGHQQYMNGFAGKAKISSPAVTSTRNTAGAGLDWLNQWKTACNGQCHFDFCAVHWYGGHDQASDFTQFVDDAATACDGKPVWVTEFATTTGDASQIAAFLQDVVPKLDAHASVERYSYFWVTPGSLVESSGLSSFGHIYNSL